VLERSRPCAVASQYLRRDAHARNGVCALRYYNTTRLLQQQSQSPPQSREEDTTELGEHATYLSENARGRIRRPAESIREEIADTQEIVGEQDASFELSESELQREKLKNSVRELMRNVPSSVAVLTVASTDLITRKSVPVGVAVSSLSTVTLDPPTISFNIKEPSQTLDAIRAAGGLFRVHYPTADRGGAKLVDLFCRGNHPDAYSLRLKELRFHLPRDKKDRRNSPSLAPQILQECVLAAMECKVTHEFPIADHVILVARVNSLEQKISQDPAIMYINGKYRSPRGEDIYTPAGFRSSVASKETGSVWDYPLFPGEKERRHYMEQIKTIVKANPAYYETPSRETYRNIDSNLPYAAANFGISLELLVAECRQEMGLPGQLRPNVDGQQVLNDFYGSLTPSMRDQIVDRAKKLVALDAHFLSQDYRTFLYNLGVNPNSRDFLPSDIMEPLRKANLAPPFDPQRGHVNRGPEDITKLERIEYHLRDHLRKMKYEAALRTPFEEAMEAIGERKTAALNFKKARARLLTESHPTLFDASAIDIAGEVTHEELRVVLCRLINRLHINSQTGFRNAMVRDWREHLRRVGVSPTITGMDVDFMMGKIKHLYYSTRKFSDFPRAVEDMLRPWFVWDVSWEDLEGRVERFVQSIPLRATAWSGKDRLAAMGLHWDATVTIPGSNPSKQANKEYLSRGAILDILVAKQLKNYYGRGNEEENQAIAKYLRQTYGFDVTHKPIQYQPAASASQSSGDEMQQAMMETLDSDQEKKWFIESIPEQSLSTQGGATPSRKADGSSYIRRTGTDQELVRRIVRKPRN
jgi:flavin reductase (DIM6/NTAB) family NADH-FMN oxidoreductase RutF